MQSPRLSVRRGRRLTVIVSAAHAWWGILIQFGLEPIKDDTLGRLAISLIRNAHHRSDNRQEAGRDPTAPQALAGRAGRDGRR
jgi:hypothetical protein